MPLSKTNQLRWKVLLKDESDYCLGQQVQNIHSSYGENLDKVFCDGTRQLGDGQVLLATTAWGTVLVQPPNAKRRIMRYS